MVGSTLVTQSGSVEFQFVPVLKLVSTLLVRTSSCFPLSRSLPLPNHPYIRSSLCLHTCPLPVISAILHTSLHPYTFTFPLIFIILVHFSFHPFICHLFIFLPFVQSCNQPSFIRPPPAFPSIHLSIQTYPRLPIQKFHHLFCPSSLHPIIYLSTSPSIPASIYPPSNPVVHSSFHSFSTSFHSPFHLSIYPPTHVFINLFSLHTSNHPPPSTVHPLIHPSRIHPFFHPPTYPSIHASLYPYVLSTHKSIQPSTPVHLPTRSHSPSFYPFFISCTLSLTTHVMILTYKHPSSFHTQIYPPIHLSIPPQYMVIYAFICTYPLMYLLVHPPNQVSTHVSKHHLSCHPSTRLFFPLYLHLSIHYPPSHPVLPHSFISLFLNYFPFHLPLFHLLASPLC